MAGTVWIIGDTPPNQWNCSEFWRYVAKQTRIFGTLRMFCHNPVALIGTLLTTVRPVGTFEALLMIIGNNQMQLFKLFFGNSIIS